MDNTRATNLVPVNAADLKGKLGQQRLEGIEHGIQLSIEEWVDGEELAISVLADEDVGVVVVGAAKLLHIHNVNLDHCSGIECNNCVAFVVFPSTTMTNVDGLA